MTTQSFDGVADAYDNELQRGLSLTGEDKEYFAQQRITHLARCIESLDSRVERLLDFGCGTGAATPYFFRHLHIRSLTGLDTSIKSLDIARDTHAEYPARFVESTEYELAGQEDCTFTNGVFHHIPPDQRHEALAQVFAALRPLGLFAFWENNPWNPGTRYIMSRVSFDRDAILIWPGEARRILRRAGFRILRTDFLFIFPNCLRFLRPLERPLSRLPLGGQYQVLCQKRP